MNHRTLSLLLGLTAAATIAQASTPWITGFWSAGNSRESIGNIPWSNITHLTYFAASFSSTGTVLPGYTSQPELANLVSAAHSHGVKVIIVISDGTGYQFEPAAGASLVNTTVSNLASYINSNGFDGVDFDWEANVSMTDYESLISHTRAAMPGKLILTDVYNPGNLVTVMANQYSNLDQINAMCYDMDNIYMNGGAKPWYNDALFNGPLTVGQGGTCQWRMDAFTNAGVPAAKMGVGIPFYGRRWSGATLINQGKGSMVGPVYYGNLVTDSTRWQPANIFYDPTYGSDYLSIPALNEFDSFTGTKSIQAAVANAKTKGYGGYMAFTLEYEYVSSQTGNARYPLSSTLNSAVFGTTTTPPTISAFTANPATITAGSSTTLSWSTSGATSLTIDQGVGTVTGTTSKTVSPTATTTCTLTATNAGGSVTKSLTVVVTTPVAPPTISAFMASPSTLTMGSSSMLSWSTSGATSLTIDQGVGTVTGTTSKTVSPTATTTYTLTATNAAGSVTQTTTMAVITPGNAYWKLDDGARTSALDSSGNGYTMTLAGAPAWQTATSCVLNGCLAFSGKNQYGLATVDLSGTKAITIEFWMKWNAYANDNYSVLEFSPNFNNSTTGFLILPDESVSGQFQAGFKGNAGYNQVNFARPSAGVWHHYAFVMDKSAPALTQVIPYVDGQAISYNKPTAAANTNYFAKDTLFVMSRNGTSLFGAGTLDEIQIYPQALSASAIQNLATKNLAPATRSTSPTITTASSLSTGTEGLPYSHTLTSSGSEPATWTLASGSLPNGLSLDASSGQISGKPSKAGSYSFILNASNMAGSDSRQFVATVNSASTSLTYDLTDLNWQSATTGWGTVRKDTTVLGNILTLNGTPYTQGLGTHANSKIVYDLGSACNVFQSSVGIDDETGSHGSVVFQAFGDGVKLYDSKTMTGTSPTQNIDISVAGKQQLELVVADSGDGTTFDHADWAHPTLTCSSPPPAAN